MTNVAEIEKAIERLPKNELAELSAWFDRFELDAWDEQIARDAAAGKFESLYAEAAADLMRAGLRNCETPHDSEILAAFRETSGTHPAARD